MHEEKKEEKRKIAHTFKGNHQKERESCSKEYKKYLELGRFLKKFHTLAHS